MLIAAFTRPAGAVTVHLDAQDASSTVILHTGDRLRVELPSVPATGLVWKAKLLDASHLEPLSNELRPESGREGTQIFVWKAISAGLASIDLTYAHSEDPHQPPAKQMAIAVEVVAGDLPSGDVNSAGLVPLGVYSGELPCGDCSAIAVDLGFYGPPSATTSPAAAAPTVFVERRRYRGAPGGDRTIAGSGEVKVIQGTYADASMTVYQLTSPDGGTENFGFQGRRLIPLDAQMLPLPSTPPGKYGLRQTMDANGCATGTAAPSLP